MVLKKRVISGLIIGAILGLVCIGGAYLRMPNQNDPVYLFSLWYNRVLMGLVIGILGRAKTIKFTILRGFILGGLISYAFYATTGHQDLISFLAGFIYGIIIDLALYKLDKKRGL
jgi:uncharacterized membrane protein (UPF0136 family)